MFNKIIKWIFPEVKKLEEKETPLYQIRQILRKTKKMPEIVSKKTTYYHNIDKGYTVAYHPLNKKELNELSLYILRNLKFINKFGWLEGNTEKFKLKIGVAFLNPKDGPYIKELGRKIAKSKLIELEFILDLLILEDGTINIRMTSENKVSVTRAGKYLSLSIDLSIKDGRELPWLKNAYLY